MPVKYCYVIEVAYVAKRVACLFPAVAFDVFDKPVADVFGAVKCRKSWLYTYFAVFKKHLFVVNNVRCLVVVKSDFRSEYVSNAVNII